VVLRAFERRLENLVEGTFARVFKSGLTPLEIGRRIQREADANQSLAVDGSIAVPNHYWVYVSTVDYDRFAEVSRTLCAELAEALRDHARDEEYRLFGPVVVTLVEANDYAEGSLQVQAQWREVEQQAGRASLVLSTGERVPVGDDGFTIGRLADCSLVLTDTNVSRMHAEINKSHGRWMLLDLGSTNGTTVNGTPISEIEVTNGDLIVFGSAPATFEIS